MAFKQVLAKYIPIDSKNKLNKLLADVERNFGVFSRDMELDIRVSITSPVVLDYFDRIIHEEHPKLEHDVVPLKENNKGTGVITNKGEKPTLDAQSNITLPKAQSKKKKSPKTKKLVSGTIAEHNDTSQNIYTHKKVDSIVNFFKKNNQELNAATEGWVRSHIIGKELLDYYKERMKREVAGYYSVVFRVLNMGSVGNKERRKRRIELFTKKLSAFMA